MKKRELLRLYQLLLEFERDYPTRNVIIAKTHVHFQIFKEIPSDWEIAKKKLEQEMHARVPASNSSSLPPSA